MVCSSWYLLGTWELQLAVITQHHEGTFLATNHVLEKTTQFNIQSGISTKCHFLLQWGEWKHHVNPFLGTSELVVHYFYAIMSDFLFIVEWCIILQQFTSVFQCYYCMLQITDDKGWEDGSSGKAPMVQAWGPDSSAHQHPLQSFKSMSCTRVPSLWGRGRQRQGDGIPGPYWQGRQFRQFDDSRLRELVSKKKKK